MDITRLACRYTFAPTRKQAKEYRHHLGATPGSMPPMSYTVCEEEQTVVTYTADGAETANVAWVGDIIMSGPSGENYVVRSESFSSLYDGEIGAVVVPNQDPRMVARYEGTSEVVFRAPWGEDMVLKPGDYLVADGDDSFYRIAREEYEDTYNAPGH